MKTSVIIPTYNRAGFLRRAVTSLERQREDVDLDIIIVDDGSTDGTPALLDQLSSQYPGIRVFRQENLGISAARNTGLLNLLPETEIVTFLDSDDVSPKSRFALDLPLFEAHSDLEMSYGEVEMVEEIDDETLERAADSRCQRFVGIQLACALFRRGAINAIGLFDPGLKQAEDSDFLFRFFELGRKFMQTKTRCVVYLRHPGSVSLSIADMRKYMAHALVKSIQRRRADPSRPVGNLIFPLKQPAEMNFES